MTRFAVLIFLLVSSISPAAIAQDDPRVAQAVELFRAGDFVAAATLFEAIERDAPANFLRLNAMVAWYKADRCPEARAVMGRVVDDSTIEPPDRRDIDKVGTYCTLKDARTQADAGETDRALATLQGLQTEDVGLKSEVAALRTKLEERKAAEEQAKITPPVETKPDPTPPPPAPAERPRWALTGGLAGIGTGIALGSWATIKYFAVDRPAFRQGLDDFARVHKCDGEVYSGCTSAQRADIEDDPGFRDWEKQSVKVASTLTAVLGVTGGVVGAAGIGLLVYYLTSPSEAPAQQSFLILPTLGHGTVGATLQLRF